MFRNARSPNASFAPPFAANSSEYAPYAVLALIAKPELAREWYPNAVESTIAPV